MRHCLPWSFLIVCLVVCPADAQVSVGRLRVGFGGAAAEKDASYKIGSWSPAVVTLRPVGEFNGGVEISTSDSDDVPATFGRAVQIAGSDQADVMVYVKPGKVQPSFRVRVHDANGRTISSESFESATGRVAAGSPQKTTVIVTVGRPAGLDVEEIGKRPGYVRDDFRIAHTKSAYELPDRWFGFDAVDDLVVCTSDLDALKWLDERKWPQDTPHEKAERQAVRERSAALETWVRQGGQLVLSVGSDWSAATELFGHLMPATIDHADTLRRLTELESYVGQNAPAIQLASPLTVPHLNVEGGRVLAGTRDTPLVVRGPFGLGSVTLVALDFRRDASGGDPLRSWEGSTDFWIKLLRLPRQRATDRARQGAWSQRAASDLSSHLHVGLERFAGVSIVPFHLVAALVFGYVVVVGPADYWLVRRLNRMSLTWVTFPVTVVGACLVAYLGAHWLKGNSLAVNQVDVIDVDAATGTLRGTSWFTLFSPTIKKYTVAVQPQARWMAETSSWSASPPETASWLGVAEDAIGGIGRKGGVRLLGSGYRFGPDASSLDGVTVPVWSTKGFFARWLGSAATTLQTDLRSSGVDRVRGPITNRTGAALTDCILAFGGRAYPLGNLPVGGSVLVQSATTEDLRGHITRRAEESDRRHSHRVAIDGTDDRGPLAFYDLILTMMFRDRIGDDNQIPANDFFDEIELSQQLDHHRAIFVGRVAVPGSQLVLDGSPTARGDSSATALRVILPVAAAPPAPEERRDPRDPRSF